MKKFLTIPMLVLFSLVVSIEALPQDSKQMITPPVINRAGSMLISDTKLNIGGYGQVDYNQPFGGPTLENGKLDVHRLVLLFGYRFTDRLSFVTEVEIEHVKEVFVEQAFINYSFFPYLNFRAGLMLVPMGIINEYHEPNTFNGVERPLIDKYIAPTTWREIGLGATGIIPGASMKYQVYLMNGFKSYDDQRLLDGKNGLRKGRQKGAESIIRFPNFSGRVSYYGILGLNIGLSAYYGKTQSTMYSGLEKSNPVAIQSADSSVVGVAMVGFDLRYNRKGVEAKGQIYYTSVSNTLQYNAGGESEESGTLGSSMYGYYLEVAYNVFHPFEHLKTRLVPFVRYSNYDTQASVTGMVTKNNAYNKTVITSGLGFWFVPQVAIKADVQFIKAKANAVYSKIFNAGVAFMF